MKLTKKWLLKHDACPESIEWWVARGKNPDAVEVIRDMVAGGWRDWARWLVARIQDAATLASLAQNANADVHWAVVLNPHTPPRALAALAGDADAYVRRAVAYNPHTPAATLAKLAGDADAYVRWAVAYNPHAPKVAK
jgi:hypothetical protein